ncbi:MAG: DUF4956 domain-containing protein [Eubacteriales bacterium]|nr:DUF4956 domain-containing protein [Eubacteriales bacterium]MDD4475559.1 DUF4956 domain-containing protein [Eubacteriales bacterium]
MLSSIISATGLTLQNTLFCTAASIGLGLLLAGAYLLQGNHTKNFTVSLVMLPLLVQAVIMMVNGNIGTGVAVMGAFSLIRFRSFPGSSRDITAIFAAMSVGIATGMGFLGFALIIAIVFATLSVILSKIPLKGKETADRELKITIPETLNYTEVFTDILDKYTKNASLEKVRTTNMGSMYEITYLISLKASNTEKQLIDELRCRNGNLPIILHRAQTAKDEL